MSEQINPYMVFLDLDTAPSKPTLYQLLRVDQQEQDHDVIGKACEQALAKVRSYKPGSNARIWAAILDEISEARMVLTNPGKREQYDQQLASGEEPGVLELLELAGPVESVVDGTATSSNSDQVEPTDPGPSLADQLVPSHLASGTGMNVGVSPQPIATPVARSPQIPVATQVPLTVGSTSEAGLGNVASPVSQSSASFSLENGTGASSARVSRRRKRKSQSGFPMPLILVTVMLLGGGITALVLINGGNTEIAQQEPDQNLGEDEKPGSVIMPVNPDESTKPDANTEDSELRPVDPQPKDPGTGENPLKPLPEKFGKPEPDPMPEEKPAEPMPEKPEVETENTEPEREPLTADEKKQLSEALKIARLALAERNMEIVLEKLNSVSALARTGAPAEAFQRLKLMHELVTNFDRLANQAMDGYQSGSEINVGSSTKAVVVEVTPEELTIKAAGVVRSHPRNKLSVGLAMGIASTNFNDPVMTPYMKAAYLVTLKSDRFVNQAREMWQSGNSASANIPADAFEAFVKDNYEFDE